MAGGIDACVGAQTAIGLRIDYDFGLYSDPLTRRDDMLGFLGRNGTADARAARMVQFRLTGTRAAAGTTACPFNRR